jgi:hypothetical protein
MAGQATAKRLEAVSDTDKPDDKPSKAPEGEDVTEPDKLDAATSEVLDNSDVKIVSWQGLELVVPKEIPPVLMFDFISMENEQGAFSLMRMFHTLLDNQQFVEVRNVIGKLDAEKQVDAISELSEVIMTSYGTSPGESEASEDS